MILLFQKHETAEPSSGHTGTRHVFLHNIQYLISNSNNQPVRNCIFPSNLQLLRALWLLRSSERSTVEAIVVNNALRILTAIMKHLLACCVNIAHH